MTRRIVPVQGLFFEWPVGANRPASFGMTARQLDAHLSLNGSARMANDAEAEAAVAANLAGPNNRKLSATELVAGYRDNFGYERMHADAGVTLLADERN